MRIDLSLANALHVLAAVIWVGGMFFAHRALRPAAVTALEPPQRLTLWSLTFARFFPWVWVSVFILPASGYWLVFEKFGGFAHVGLYIHLMHGLGIVMILIYMHVFFAPYRRLRDAVTIEDWQTGGKHLATIRKLVGLNLIIGLTVIAIAAGGRG